MNKYDLKYVLTFLLLAPAKFANASLTKIFFVSESSVTELNENQNASLAEQLAEKFQESDICSENKEEPDKIYKEDFCKYFLVVG